MAKFSSYNAASQWFSNYFRSAARIVAEGAYGVQTNPVTGFAEYVQTYAGRAWFRREYRRYQLHDAIGCMIEEHQYCPDNWHQLLLEWPHKSSTDPNRLAYTRDERSGEADRQVVTTIGKYLMRHFPDAPDHLIRDVVAKYTYGGKIHITKDMDEMIAAVRNGPSSCMSRDFCIYVGASEYKHPYAVYDPSLGWRMAVRTDADGTILGRCLLWHDDAADERIFVRSYKRERDSYAHSGTDEAINAHLVALGYKKFSEWPDGTPLMRYELPRSGYLMPYIDGNTQRVDEDTFTIDSNGDIEADSTSGTSDNANCTCDDCGDRFNDEDEGGWTGVSEDNHVCQSCLDNEYTYAYSRRGNQYYINNSDVIECDGEYYDTDYLSDNSIVQLHDGEYCHEDNAVWIESVNEYYHCDDDDICYDDDNGEYDLKDNCWQCAESGNWYNDGVDYIEIDGDKYHPDHAPEVEDDNTETN